jgi:hypothetical protein
MKRYWYRSQHRAIESVAVWQANGPAFKVGEVSLEQHAADVSLLNDEVSLMFRAEGDWDKARDDRDFSYRLIADLCTRGCQVISGSLPAGHELHRGVSEVRRARGESQEAVLQKGRKLVTLWQNVNDWRAEMTPPLPELTVADKTLAQFQGLLTNHGTLLQDVNDRKADWVESKNQLRATVDRLDRNNKRWFEAWKGEYGASTPEREALRQITTGPRQRGPGQAAILGLEWLGSSFLWTYDAARGTSFTLLVQGPGESAFNILAERVKEKRVEYEPPGPGEYRFKLIPHNSVGDGAESVVLGMNVAQTEAA